MVPALSEGVAQKPRARPRREPAAGARAGTPGGGPWVGDVGRGRVSRAGPDDGGIAGRLIQGQAKKDRTGKELFRRNHRSDRENSPRRPEGRRPRQSTDPDPASAHGGIVRLDPPLETKHHPTPDGGEIPQKKRGPPHPPVG